MNKKKYNKLIVTGTIKSHYIEYGDEKDKLDEFLLQNLNKQVNIRFDIFDDNKAKQHRYFHAYVLEPIAIAMGEDSKYVKEFILKQEFLFFKISSYKEISRRHIQKIRTVSDRDQLIGYIPSLSVISYEEYRDFILKCEKVRDGMMGWGFNLEAAKEALYLRNYSIIKDHGENNER